MLKKIIIPDISLIILVGSSGSGKSTFAKKHFKPTEVISSDYCRGLISDDENDQKCTPDAFEVLRYIAAKRLKAGKVTVIDATNVQPEARRTLIKLARSYHALPIAIVLNIPREICYERNQERPNRKFGKHVIWNQYHQLQRSFKSLKKKEGLTKVHILNSAEEADTVELERQPTWTNKKIEQAPFDIIGDIHGCFDELQELLVKLGYQITQEDKFRITHPDSRRLIFLGDLLDRGPNSPKVLRLVMDAVASGIAFCVNGNHEERLRRRLMGYDVKITHGLQETLDQLDKEPIDFKKTILEFLKSRISHYVLDDGKLAVSHAGLKEEFLGRGSPYIRKFCIYGEVTGEIDEFGLPTRYPWADDYRGDTLIVYGHTPVAEPLKINNTINIDTGCVFGGKLTALRYPEKTLVSVNANKTYATPIRPLAEPEQIKTHENILDITDVIGKRIIETRLHRNITIREENAASALEVMSRFSIDPRWLIYLPPTMSPTEACKTGNLLEHPAAAISFFKKRGVSKLICEEKHMGSRAIVVICRDNDVAKKRFGIRGDEIGSCYTRTGRNFFDKPKIEKEFLIRVQQAVSKSHVWEKLETDWLCLDTELMPWSAKAQLLLKEQYAAVGAAAETALLDTNTLLLEAAKRNIDGTQELCDRFNIRLNMVSAYRNAYRQYCWPVQSLEDYKLAPFHVLAHENNVNTDKNHLWHLEIINLLHEADPQLFQKTEYKIIDLEDEVSCNNAINWWFKITEHGGEGMVVKPLDFTVRTDKGLLQPGIKCRGREYLRIIYGPEYTAPENLERLRFRNINGKRKLALREYALGCEALHLFVDRKPLHKIHEAVFGILALESEPIDPRL